MSDFDRFYGIILFFGALLIAFLIVRPYKNYKIILKNMLKPTN